MTLLMRDQENIEKGIEKGIQQGIQTGKIYGVIMAFKEMELPENIILEKLQTKFHLSKDEAKKYIDEAEKYIDKAE